MSSLRRRRTPDSDSDREDETKERRVSLSDRQIPSSLPRVFEEFRQVVIGSDDDWKYNTRDIMYSRNSRHGDPVQSWLRDFTWQGHKFTVVIKKKIGNVLGRNPSHLAIMKEYYIPLLIAMQNFMYITPQKRIVFGTPGQRETPPLPACVNYHTPRYYFSISVQVPSAVFPNSADTIERSGEFCFCGEGDFHYLVGFNASKFKSIKNMLTKYTREAVQAVIGRSVLSHRMRPQEERFVSDRALQTVESDDILNEIESFLSDSDSLVHRMADLDMFSPDWR